MHIYLHFLDRELRSSIDAEIKDKTVSDILKTCLLINDQEMYCSLSHLWETCCGYTTLLPNILKLVQNNQLWIVSHHTTLPEFLESRTNLYKHDKKRYPFYFNQVLQTPFRKDELIIIPKLVSTTSYLLSKMQLLFSGKDRFNAESQETKSMLMSIGPNIRGTLDSIGDKALTFALFSSQLKSHSPSESYFLRRTISELYTKHYLDWLKGDILTGIPKYGYFDYMSNSFPLNDYYLSRILLEVLFPNLYSPSADDDVFMLLAQSRKTIQHVQFSKTIRNILTALWFLNTAQSNKLGMTLIRDCICKDLNLMKLQSPLKYAHIEIDAGQEYYGRAIDLLSETCLVFDSIKTGFKDALKLANNIEEGKMNRILICLATDLENRVFWEISKSNGFSPQTAYSGELAYQIIGTRKGCELLALRSEAGSGGTAGSQLSTLDAVDALKPNFVISLGVAFGSDQTIQAMGDVLVSQQIRCYELQRVGPTNIIPRGDLMPCDPSLLARFEAAKLTWSKCKIHTGLILSGDKLVDSPEFKKQLLSMAPEAIGGEMEGAGIVSSCYRRRTPWILAKGICDWAESKGDKHQEIAAQNTMNLFYDILESGGWSTVAN